MRFWLVALCFLSVGLSQQRFLGLEAPKRIPLRFLPPAVRPDHSVPTISPDGLEIFWAQRWEDVSHRRILSARFQDGQWSSPQVAAFSQNDDGDCPIISPDGQMLIFNPSRAISKDGTDRRERFWCVTRTASGWSDPLPLANSVNGEHLHWQGSIDRNGNLYFGSERKGSIGSDDIFVAARTEDGYSTPRSLPNPINTKSHESTPFIGPDGEYLLFSRVDYSSVPLPYPTGLLVSYKRNDGTWREPVPVPLPGVRSEGVVCPFVTRDGRFLLFLSMSQSEKTVYWVDASVVSELRRQE